MALASHKGILEKQLLALPHLMAQQREVLQARTRQAAAKRAARVDADSELSSELFDDVDADEDGDGDGDGGDGGDHGHQGAANVERLGGASEAQIRRRAALSSGARRGAGRQRGERRSLDEVAAKPPGMIDLEEAGGVLRAAIETIKSQDKDSTSSVSVGGVVITERGLKVIATYFITITGSVMYRLLRNSEATSTLSNVNKT